MQPNDLMDRIATTPPHVPQQRAVRGPQCDHPTTCTAAESCPWAAVRPPHHMYCSRGLSVGHSATTPSHVPPQRAVRGPQRDHPTTCTAAESCPWAAARPPHHMYRSRELSVGHGAPASEALTKKDGDQRTAVLPAAEGQTWLMNQLYSALLPRN